MSAPRAPIELRQHALALALREAFEFHRDALLVAPTGAGKSTVVPLSLLDEPWVAGAKILMLEPRRLAARAVSARMAALLGESVGATVGYRMRLETRVSHATRIEVVTEGVLTRLLHADPALEGVACVIFDEYHERTLQADLALALALHARRELEATFRVLVMSATLDPEPIADLLGEAAIVRVPGRAFPVELRYLGRGAASLESEHPVALGVRRALDECAGDVLAFLPGEGEIHRLESALADQVRGVQVLPLYGQMASSAQDAVLTPAPPGQRKVVLATNVAETSLTILGIEAVVDSGLVRRPRFDPNTGMSRLELMRISRAASEQRAGRAGRTAPGICYRLWSSSAQDRLAEATPPEILAADLAPLALELARWGIRDAAVLPWLNPPPPPAALAQARSLLERLEALDADTSLTRLGSEMASLALHPRLSHMLLAARALAAVPLAAQLAALLSERDLSSSLGGARDPDLRTRLELLRGARGSGAERALIERVRRAAQALEAAVASLPSAPHSIERADADVMAGALLALAYPDRIALRRQSNDPRGASGARYLLANGRGAAFRAPAALARAELIVAVALEDSAREARIDLAVPLERAWLERLFGARIVSEPRLRWDPRAAGVSARQIRRLDALVLSDEPLANVPPAQALAAMLEGVRALGLDSLPWDEATRNLQARMEFVRAQALVQHPDWPASDDAALLSTLESWLASYLRGVMRREQLAHVPLAAALRARLSSKQQRALDSLAPHELTVPSGSRVRIDYRDDNAPCVAVRLQEVFGLEATPRIAGGTVPITFKLLSPARRPVQITRDLAGFWRSSYREVRKDLRGRYPKHDWPEDPLHAVPSHRVRPR